MLTFQWDAIKANGLALDQQLELSRLPELSALEGEGEYRFLSPLSVGLRIDQAGDLLEVTGDIRLTVEVTCSRCLGRFETQLETDFELSLARELPSVTDEDGTEVELTADEMGLILIEDDSVDLTPWVVEQAIMALPYRILCNEDCQGYCASCGADLNQQACQCRPERVLNKFAALKDFKVDK